MGFMDIFKISEFKREIAHQKETIENQREVLKTQEETIENQKEVLKTQEETIENQRETIENQSKRLADIGADNYEEVTKKVTEINRHLDSLNVKVEKSNNRLNALKFEIDTKTVETLNLERKMQTNINKIKKSKEIYKSIQYAENQFEYSKTPNINQICEEIDKLIPSVFLHLHNMDVRSLNSAFKENDKQIEKIMKSYEGRYTTKANQSLYKLMVIALRAELQNILCELKYGKIDKSIEQIKTITAKYLQIAINGNQNIAPTITRFIGEMEYLFINAAKIEYNYYVKKEQSRQEQLAIRQQMREEAEERKLLEQERRRMEQEESKYNQELSKIKELLLTSVNEVDTENFQKRILELEINLSNLAVEKEKIVTLQHGKAGTVYIISNKGAFGDNIFKIGMTRRIDPTERIGELSGASVPFKYDIHSLVFSDDAVALESELHKRLHEKRLNKVNLRKEFFNCTIDELENLVYEIEPTSEFIRTMAAEEYNASINSCVNFETTTFYNDEDNSDDDNINGE